MTLDRLYAEDIVPDTTTVLGNYTLSAAQIIDFGAQWDPQPMHTDLVLASESGFGSLIASGIQSLGVLQRLTVEALYYHWHVFAGKQFRAVRFLRPVPAGSTLTGHSTLESIEFNRPERALVTSRGFLTIAEVTVLDVIVETYVLRRQPRVDSK